MSNQKSYDSYSPPTGKVVYGRGPTDTPWVCPINDSYSPTSPIIDLTQLNLNIFDEDFITPEKQTQRTPITTPEFLLMRTQKKRSRFMPTTSIPQKFGPTLKKRARTRLQKKYRSTKRKLDALLAEMDDNRKQ